LVFVTETVFTAWYGIDL